MKKIIIIGYSLLCEKQKVTLGIDKLSEEFSIEYWDLTQILGDQSSLPEININGVMVYKIQSFHDFANKVDSLCKDSFVIFYMFVNEKTYDYYRLLTETECKLATVATGAQPINARRTNLTGMLKIVKKCLDLSSIFSFLKRKVVEIKMEGLRPFDYCFYAGADAFSQLFRPNPLTVKVPINDFDYELARNQPKERVIDGKYILFLDQYEPFHPDFEVLGKTPVESHKYYKEINTYFDKIEKQYGVPVVIAAHPKAERYHSHNFFDGRKVFFGLSGKLAYFSEFVIMHNSTSISYPVMFKKRILFIYTSDMLEIYPGYVIFEMARRLGSNVVNISKTDDTRLFELNEDFYDNYLYSFLTSKESFNRKNYEIIQELINSAN